MSENLKIKCDEAEKRKGLDRVELGWGVIRNS